MTTSRLHAHFIMVKCSCGRILRAKWDQVGTEIVCWDCRATTKVLIPRARLRLFAQISRTIAELFGKEGSGRIVGAAGLLTLAYLIPYAGLAVVALLLVGGAAIYGDTIRQMVELVDRSEPLRERIRRESTGSRLIACILFATGTIVPIWVWNAGAYQSPHLDRVSLPLLVVAWTVLPVFMAAVYAVPDSPNQKTWRRFRFVAAYPVLTLLTLAIVPLSVLACEVGVTTVLYLMDILPFCAMDYMPAPGKPSLISGIYFYGNRSYLEFPPGIYINSYFTALKHGYSFFGSIPPSLSLATRTGLAPTIIYMSDASYFGLKVCLMFGINLTLILSYTIQARCFNVLVNAQRHRTG